MSKQTEALKLALETAEGILNADWRKWDELASPAEFERWAKSRAYFMATILREALAEQPAPVAKLHEQEPVAHRDDFWCADLTCKKCYSADFRFKHKNSVVNESLTTPAQRTWVGLPESALAAMTLQQVSAMKYAELVLKEKNT